MGCLHAWTLCVLINMHCCDQTNIHKAVPQMKVRDHRQWILMDCGRRGLLHSFQHGLILLYGTGKIKIVKRKKKNDVACVRKKSGGNYDKVWSKGQRQGWLHLIYVVYETVLSKYQWSINAVSRCHIWQVFDNYKKLQNLSHSAQKLI